MGETVSVSVGLEQAVAAYKEGPTPELVTVLWEKFWREAGQRVGMELTVAEFPGTEESLAEHLRVGDMPIYVPPELAIQENRYLLGRMWPEMGSYSTARDNPVTNAEARSGWRYIEVSRETPQLHTTESELSEVFAELGRGGMNLTEYVIGAQMGRELTGYYFDEDTWSRLLGSRQGNRVVSAYFESGGSLRVSPSLDARTRYGVVGERSSEGVV